MITETAYRDNQLKVYYDSQKLSKPKDEIKKWIITTLKQWATDGDLRETDTGEIILPDKIEDDDGYIYTIAQWFDTTVYGNLWQELQKLYEEVTE